MPISQRPLSDPAQRGWLLDFGWDHGRLHIRKTDIRLKIDHKLVAEVLQWLPYLSILTVRSVWARLFRDPALSIWFAPDRPRPWYLARGAALWAGISVARTAADADVSFYFDDVTSAADDINLQGVLNGACTDVSKSHVASIFKDVFGYPLAVDPLTFKKPTVEKSEKNGVHDGRIFPADGEVSADCVYQRLVDTTDDDGAAHDLRTLCANGSPVLVWLKIKPSGARFAIHNRKALLKDPTEMFSTDEIARIGQFTARMGLDWGGLDILRDRHDGRIYIVDVNKTDVGPVIALSWRDKIRSMGQLAKALEGLVNSRSRSQNTVARPVEPYVIPHAA